LTQTATPPTLFTRTYYRSIQSLTVKYRASRSLARTHLRSALNAHTIPTHTQTRRSSHACPASPVLLRAWRRNAVSNCPCVCVAVVAQAGLHYCYSEEEGRKQRLPNGHGRDESCSMLLPYLLTFRLPRRVSSKGTVPGLCSGYTHMMHRQVERAATSDEWHRRISDFVRAAWRHGEHGSRPRALNTPPSE